MFYNLLFASIILVSTVLWIIFLYKNIPYIDITIGIMSLRTKKISVIAIANLILLATVFALTFIQDIPNHIGNLTFIHWVQYLKLYI